MFATWFATLFGLLLCLVCYLFGLLLASISSSFTKYLLRPRPSGPKFIHDKLSMIRLGLFSYYTKHRHVDSYFNPPLFLCSIPCIYFILCDVENSNILPIDGDYALLCSLPRHKFTNPAELGRSYGMPDTPISHQKNKTPSIYYTYKSWRREPLLQFHILFR